MSPRPLRTIAIGVAGMEIGRLFTLFVTPAVYTFLARDHAALIEREGARASQEGGDRGGVRQLRLQRIGTNRR
jgi:hypothetical protein